MAGPAAIDRATAVRAGEMIDVERLEAFLRAHVPDASGPLVVEQFPRGFSNLTYLLRLGERELVLRRPPFGAQVRSGHDVGREYRILSALISVYPKVPRPIACTDDDSIIGAPFYVMERVRGIILRDRPPEGVTLDAERMRGICEALVDTLVELHAVDYAAAGLGDLGRPEGYVERQVSGWITRYQNARTGEVTDMDSAAAWLKANQPPVSGAALIHNDFKYDNLVLDPNDLTRVIAVLDWEMATIGDPLMDLGTTLGYWVQADDTPELGQIGLTARQGNLSRDEVAQRYAAKSGRDVSDILFYYVYGLFKVAVICQQIYFRYRRGFTRDPRFGKLDILVAACARSAVRAIERHRVDDLA